MATVMVVDDSLFMRNHLSKLLARNGYESILAENGEQAVHAYRRSKPNVVLMDITMPRKDGLQALTEIRELDSKAKVIMLTAVDQETGLALRSIFCVPLHVERSVIGVLEIADTEPNRFGMEDQTLSESLAVSAAVAIANARLYEAAQQELTERKRAEEALAQKAAELMGDYQYVLGASIGPCCYDVKDDVTTLFMNSYGDAVVTRRGRAYIDLKKAVIKDLGHEHMIGSLEYCTRCESRYFYSHRRGDNKKRNYAGIVVHKDPEAPSS